MCQSLFFNKVECRTQPETLFKKRLLHKCFLVNFVKFFKTPFCFRTALVAASESPSLGIWKVRKIQRSDHVVSNYVNYV